VAFGNGRLPAKSVEDVELVRDVVAEEERPREVATHASSVVGEPREVLEQRGGTARRRQRPARARVR
jgi:hypothetical protein